MESEQEDTDRSFKAVSRNISAMVLGMHMAAKDDLAKAEVMLKEAVALRESAMNKLEYAEELSRVYAERFGTVIAEEPMEW